MKHTITSVLIAFLLKICTSAQAQIAQNYSVGTWSDFKTAAITYSFDDNCPNQLTTILPTLDQYKFKATYFVVINWGPNWSKLKTMSANGHEVASHSMSHPTSLADQADATQENELSQSQSTINNNITDQKCVTIAYPNCKQAKTNLLSKYYIAGRNCDGAVNATSPSDFFAIKSFITGNTGINTANAFNQQVNNAKSSKGWCMFLTHGIDTEADGYSPTNSSEMKTHLAYVNTNIADFWVGTFRDVTKYIKERNAANIAETTIDVDSLQFTLTDNLDNTIYNYPITVRRALPSTWTAAKVYSGNKVITSSLVDVSGKKYIQFNLAPDLGKSAVVNANRPLTGTEEATAINTLTIDPNPFVEETSIKLPGTFNYSIHTLEGKLMKSGTAENTVHFGSELHAGTYLISISQNGNTITKKIIKR